jgi:hypothetical protein
MTWRIAMTEAAAPPDNNQAEKEIEATLATYKALKALDEDARERVVKHVTGMLGINAALKPANEASDDAQDDDRAPQQSNGAPNYETFAELFNVADPQTDADKALVAGYWLQVCKSAENFDGQSANKELNHLGHRLANITVALSSLNSRRPALAIQLSKSGSSQQARKTYKLTVAGVDAVKAMLNG